MSKENVEIVRQLSEAFQRRDHEAAFRFYDDEIEWDASRLEEAIPDLAGVYRGHEGVRTYWRRWLSAWRDLEYSVQDIVDSGGDDVVLLVKEQRQWGRNSGIETSFPPFGIVFTIRDGKVMRWASYPDQKAALEAAGLSEGEALPS